MNFTNYVAYLYNFFMSRYEVKDLELCEQSPVYHPEGNALNHTINVVNQVTVEAKLGKFEDMDAKTLLLAAWLHDLGKSVTKKFDEKKQAWTYYKHADESSKISERLLPQIELCGVLPEKVLWIIANHMKPMDFKVMRQSKKDKLMANPWFKYLMEFYRMDALGSNGDLSDYKIMSDEFYKFKNKEENEP